MGAPARALHTPMRRVADEMAKIMQALGSGPEVFGLIHYPKCEASSYTGGITVFYICGRSPRMFRPLEASHRRSSMTTVTNNLNHRTWDRKYHVVFTPKYRKKILYGMIRRDLREVFHRLAKQKECVIEAGHLMPDHVHMLIAIAPKHSIRR
jgi:putative transposase